MLLWALGAFSCRTVQPKTVPLPTPLQTHLTAHGAGRIQTQTAFRQDARAATRADEKSRQSFRSSETSCLPLTLRFPLGDGWRPQVVGGAERPIARSRGQAPRHASRRSPRL